MAVGDVVSGISSIGAGSALTYQPSAGVEVIITGIGFDDYFAAAMKVQLYDGTNTTGLFQGANANRPENSQNKILLTNSIYLRIYNGDTSPHNLGYCGVQTK